MNRVTLRTGRWFAIAGMLLLAVAACSEDITELEIKLEDQANSGQSGTAILKSVDGQTEVSINVNPGSPDDVPQPVHIHFGTCGTGLGEVHIFLNDVNAGVSTTVIDGSLTRLLNGNFAINLHKSLAEISVYTACGNIQNSQ